MHLADHRAFFCSSGTRKPARKSRRQLMVTHLAEHGILEPAAGRLADKWQSNRNKRAFACGFCVRSFNSIKEQLNHIDNEHYRAGEDKSKWSMSTLIKGLLHQPKVEKHWQRLLLMSDIPRSEDYYHWELHEALDLQQKLETSDETGADLALTAYGCGIYGSNDSSSRIVTNVTVPVLQRMASQSGSLAARYRSSEQKISTTTSAASSAIADKSFTPIISKYQHEIPPGVSMSNIHPGCPGFGLPNLSSTDFSVPFPPDYLGEHSHWQEIPTLDDVYTYHHAQQYPCPQPISTPSAYSTCTDPAVLGIPDRSAQFAHARTFTSGLAIKREPSAAPTASHHSSSNDLKQSSRDKPLPEIPELVRDKEKSAIGARPTSPMDLGIG